MGDPSTHSACFCCCWFPRAMEDAIYEEMDGGKVDPGEEPIYEEMIPLETITHEEAVVDGGKTDAGEEMKPGVPEGSEPVKEAAVVEEEEEEEEEWEGCVQNLEEDLEDEGLPSRVIKDLIEICHKPVNERCCSHCGEIAWYQENSWLREVAMKEATEKSGQDDGEEEEEEEVEKEVCAENFIEELTFEEVPWNLFTQIVELAFRKVNPSCCPSCETIAYYQDHSWVRADAKRQKPPCVEELFPDIGRVQNFSEAAKNFPGKADPRCCLYCKRLSYFQHSDGESDSSDSEESGADSAREAPEDSGVETVPEAAGGAKEPPPSRATTPEPVREADSTQGEEEKCPCVQALFPDVWDEPVDFTLLAGRVHGRINPDCCYRCGLVELAQRLSRGEFGTGVDLPKMKVIEMDGSQLHAFLQRKMMERAEQLKQIREEGKRKESE